MPPVFSTGIRENTRFTAGYQLRSEGVKSHTSGALALRSRRNVPPTFLKDTPNGPLSAQPAITAPIASATSLSQLEQLFKATRLNLSRVQLEQLDKASRD